MQYRQVRDLYRNPQSQALFSDLSLPQFSQFLNAASGSQIAASADSPFDQAIKGPSVFIDEQLERTGAPQALGDYFAQLGQRFGAEEGGRAAGEGLPRGMVNFAPLLAGSAFGGPVGTVVGALATGALTAQDVYEKTDSPARSLVTGGVAAALPATASVGARAALAAGNKVAPRFAPMLKLPVRDKSGAVVGEKLARVPANLAERATAYVGGQTAAIGSFMGADYAMSGMGPVEFFTDPNMLFANVVGNIPFMFADIPRLAMPAPKVVLRARERAIQDMVNAELNRGSAEVAAEAKVIPETTKVENVAREARGESPEGRSLADEFSEGVADFQREHLRGSALDLTGEMNQRLAYAKNEITDPVTKAMVTQEIEARYSQAIEELNTISQKLDPNHTLLGDDPADVVAMIRDRARIDEQISPDSLISERAELFWESTQELAELHAGTIPDHDTAINLYRLAGREPAPDIQTKLKELVGEDLPRTEDDFVRLLDSNGIERPPFFELNSISRRAQKLLEVDPETIDDLLNVVAHGADFAKSVGGEDVTNATINKAIESSLNDGNTLDEVARDVTAIARGKAAQVERAADVQRLEHVPEIRVPKDDAPITEKQVFVEEVLLAYDLLDNPTLHGLPDGRQAMFRQAVRQPGPTADLINNAIQTELSTRAAEGAEFHAAVWRNPERGKALEVDRILGGRLPRDVIAWENGRLVPAHFRKNVDVASDPVRQQARNKKLEARFEKRQHELNRMLNKVDEDGTLPYSEVKRFFVQQGVKPHVVDIFLLRAHKRGPGPVARGEDFPIYINEVKNVVADDFPLLRTYNNFVESRHKLQVPEELAESYAAYQAEVNKVRRARTKKAGVFHEWEAAVKNYAKSPEEGERLWIDIQEFVDHYGGHVSQVSDISARKALTNSNIPEVFHPTVLHAIDVTFELQTAIENKDISKVTNPEKRQLVENRLQAGRNYRHLFAAATAHLPLKKAQSAKFAFDYHIFPENPAFDRGEGPPLIVSDQEFFVKMESRFDIPAEVSQGILNQAEAVRAAANLAKKHPEITSPLQDFLNSSKRQTQNHNNSATSVTDIGTRHGITAFHDRANARPPNERAYSEENGGYFTLTVEMDDGSVVSRKTRHTNSESALGWVRGWVEKTPEGRWRFNVDEVQSDAAQEYYKTRAKWPNDNSTKKLYHPLFESWETTLTQAAIREARARGWDEIFFPDAETVTMTERHHLLDTSEDVITPEFYEPKPGMRAHYDKTLPDIMRKVLGQRGEPIRLGEHPNAEYDHPFSNTETLPVKNRVGEIQSDIRGRVYKVTPPEFNPAIWRLGDKGNVSAEARLGNVEVVASGEGKVVKGVVAFNPTAGEPNYQISYFTETAAGEIKPRGIELFETKDAARAALSERAAANRKDGKMDLNGALEQARTLDAKFQRNLRTQLIDMIVDGKSRELKELARQTGRDSLLMLHEGVVNNPKRKETLRRGIQSTADQLIKEHGAEFLQSLIRPNIRLSSALKFADRGQPKAEFVGQGLKMDFDPTKPLIPQLTSDPLSYTVRLEDGSVFSLWRGNGGNTVERIVLMGNKVRDRGGSVSVETPVEFDMVLENVWSADGKRNVVWKVNSETDLGVGEAALNRVLGKNQTGDLFDDISTLLYEQGFREFPKARATLREHGMAPELTFTKEGPVIEVVGRDGNQVGAEVIARLPGAARKAIEDVQAAAKGMDPERLGHQINSAQFTELARRLAVKHGLNKAEQDAFINFLHRIKDVVRLGPVRWGEIVNDALRGDVQFAGLSPKTDGAIRKIFLGRVNTGRQFSARDAERFAGFTLAHELFHVATRQFEAKNMPKKTQKAYDDLVRYFDEARPEVREDAVKLAMEGFLPKEYRDMPEIQKLIRDAGSSPEEAMANVMAMWSVAMAEGGKVPDLAHVLSHQHRPVQGFIHQLANFGRRVLRALRDAFRMGGSDVTKESLIEKSRLAFEQLHKEGVKADKEWADLSRVADFGPELIFSDQIRFDPKSGLWKQTHDEFFNPLFFGKDGDGNPLGSAARVGAWMLERAEQLSERVPALRGAAAALMNHHGGIRSTSTRWVGEATGAGVNESGVIMQNRREFRQYRRLNSDKKLNRMFSEIAFEWQKNKAHVDPEKLGGELGAKFRQMSEADRTLIKEALGHHLKAEASKNADVLRSMHEQAEWTVAGYLTNAFRGVSTHEMAFTMAKKLVAAVDARHNPELAGLGREMSLDAIAREFDALGAPDAYLKAAQLADKLMFLKERSRAHFAETADWKLPLITYGKYVTRWSRGRGEDMESFVMRAPTEKAARALRKKIKEDPEVHSVTEEVTEKQSLYREIAPREFKFFEALDMERKAFVDSMGLDETTTTMLKSQFDTAGEVQRHINTARMFRPQRARSSKIDPDFIDMLDVWRAEAGLTAAISQNRVMNARLEYELANPALDAHARHVARFKQMVENYKKPDTGIGRAISKAVFVYTMGFNLSSHLLELSQPFFTVMPQMLSEGVTAMDAGRMVTTAGKELLTFNARMLKQKRSLDDNNQWRGISKDFPEMAEVHRAAAEDGLYSMATQTDFVEADATGAIELGAAAQGRFPDAGELATAPLKAYADLSGKLYSQFTNANARIAVRVGWELARKNFPNEPPLVKDVRNPRRKVANPKLYEEALRFARVVTFNTGRAGRPVGPFMGGDAPLWRTQGQAMNSLQSYTQGLMSQLARYAEHGFSNDLTVDLTPAQRAGAKKAFAMQVSVLFAAAGAIGMPFVGATIAALEKTTDLEINKNAREALATFFNEDDASGGFMTDMVMRGAANAILARSPVPADIGSRFAVGNIMGTDSYNGFSTKALFGPSVSLVQNMIQGTTALTEGDPLQAAEEFAPVAWKRMINLARNEGEIRDDEGGLLVDATMGEKMAFASGFNPLRVRQARDTDRILRRHRLVSRKRDSSFHDELTDMLDRGEVDKVRNMLDEKADASDGVYDARAGAKKVAERVVKRALPRDPRRDATKGTAATEQRFLRTLNMQQLPPSEVQRLQMEMQVMQALGFDPHIDANRLRQAQEIDSLMARNPSLTRAQAVMLIEQQRGTSPLSPFAP